ncbi:MAG TPA: diguanylate cyclase [Gammaproteobacteria bacterium]|nr:diguanylate cyclase [Gammaproteobacteria bacterium]
MNIMPMKPAVESRPKRALDRHCLEQIVTRSSEAVVLVDARHEESPVVYVNPAFETLTGYRADEVLGMPWRAFHRDRDGDAELDRLRAAVARGEAAAVSLPDVRKDGTAWLSRVSFSPVFDAGGDIRYWLFLQALSKEPAPDWSSTEIALLRRELGKPRVKIDPAARNDPASGLLRYEHFLGMLNRDLAIARRDLRPVSILMFEIVELDAYLSTFGAKAAESCTRMIAAQISGSLRRAGDLCARMSDAVFVAAVQGQEPVEAAAIADRIVANVLGLKLHNPRAKSGKYVTVSSAVHGGVPKPDDDAEELVDSAERALRGSTRLSPTKARG